MSALRMGARATLGLAIVALWLLWWSPTAAWLFGGLLLGRARFRLVGLRIDVLRALGRRDAARRLCEAEIARCERRQATLRRRRS